MMSRIRDCAGTSALLLGASVAYGVTPSFQGLGDFDLGHIDSQALNVSADGSTVVGIGSFERSPGSWVSHAFRWSQAHGLVDLGVFLNGTTSSATDVNQDGWIIAGTGSGNTNGGAFRWTAPTSLVSIGDLPGADVSSGASGISNDGLVVVGGSESTASGPSGGEAFRWTEAGGMVGLGDFPGGRFLSSASDVSADGDVVVGSGMTEDEFGNEYQAAFRWTAGGGMAAIGDLPGGGLESEANAVSANGLVVVGESTATGPFEQAFRWTAGTGMQGLGYISPSNNGTYRSRALGVSGDGRVVVGRSTKTASTDVAFIWTRTDGMRSLRDVLVNDFGLDLTGWTLLFAEAISDDGTVIVGYGRNPTNDFEAFIAVIPAPTCTGDITGDGVTNVSDINILASNFGAGPGATPAQGELSGDGYVNVSDFNILAGDFGCGSE